MGTGRSLRSVAWLLTLVAGIGIGTAIGQQSPPADNKGVDAQVVSTVDLAPDMSGYQLRLRKLTFEPGGVAGIHDHKGRPAFAYILEGTLTEGREGGYVKQYQAGDVITEARTVTHWAENKPPARSCSSAWTSSRTHRQIERRSACHAGPDGPVLAGPCMVGTANM